MDGIGTAELIAYVFIWTGSVFYSMYQFYLSSEYYSQYLHEDLTSGWKWLGRKVDTADYEWKMWTPIFLHWLQFVIPYIFVSLILRQKYPRIVSVINIIISFFWLWRMLGFRLTIFIFIQPFLFYVMFKLFSLAIVWVFCIAFTLALHSSHVIEVKAYLFGEDSSQEYLFAVLVAWTHARSISYLVDTRADGNTYPLVIKLLQFYHYCFYLPLLPSGPLMLYREFRSSLMNSTNNDRIYVHVLHKTATVGRYVFWWFFHQLALHYLYHSALQYYIVIVRRLDIWSAAGLGYTLGQFFMTKYLVLYGLPSALAKLDYIEAPPPPKCVGRIHLYSQMWRDFDRGLYNFMLNYIYIPFKGASDEVASKLAGTALCFGFVCIWHGASSAVVVWSVANYFGICLETAAKQFSNRSPLAHWKATWSNSNWLRFQAAAASPLLLMSALSNFFFFTDVDVGYTLARKAIYEGGLFRLLSILFVMYCCCHVSMALTRRKAKQKPTQPILNDKDQ